MGLHVACRTPTYTMRAAHRVFCNALVYWLRRFVKEMTAQYTRMLENDVMPKVLVLVADVSDAAKQLASCVGDGARAVRFTEVEIRAVDSLDVDALRDYSGVAIVGTGRSLSLTNLLDACEEAAASDFANTVFASVGSDGDVALERIARLGGIIVTERETELSAEERAKHLGKRVAKVAEWVRHALSHEHAHHHHAH